ncbi:aminotransferase [Pararhodospirillum oryzae]|uniref:Aminotransferase n=1 Tax=Pararhodospirillum oryzae TaxID=478448 RepID=A0A512H7Q1_9PROT|nr:aminotransferase [Pararhodospirillum oryzae]GEO81486.1 aminotransferase [Pararhodospirillum oryzae]
MKAVNSLFASLGTTIFTTMSALAQAHGAVNLGQGFPEGLEPPGVIEAARRALAEGPHQYPPMMGDPVLRQALARHEARFYDHAVNPDSEIMVTSGATEALAAVLLALIDPGDEVIVLEPFYDSYLPVIRRAGATARLVRLAPPAWDLPLPALEAAFSPKTKLIVVNSPMNPCGKVFTAEELALIGALARRHDAYVVCDEVYEHLVFDGQAHVPAITLPGLRERTVRIGSAGKTFSLTSWKVGYVIADAALMPVLARAHQYLTFTTPTALQRAVAWGLDQDDAYFDGLTRDMAARRDRLAQGLSRLGMTVLPTAGTYFLIADPRPLGLEGSDEAVCRTLTVEAGVTAIPVGAFHETAPASPLIRFCFAKRETDLDEALARLARFFERPRTPLQKSP